MSEDPLDGMHRVALLLPVTGPDGDVGQSIANATALALADTKATNIRMITYDTSTGVAAAAKRAIADGNKVILGPLRGDDVVEAAAVAAICPINPSTALSVTPVRKAITALQASFRQMYMASVRNRT
jgi:outer membrane PBP1 activator LpoA protein